jgi:mono/diheme cytochrome c family protein
VGIASADSAMLQDGKRLYEDTCISCHGVDGKANVDVKLVVKPRDLQKSILNEEQTYKIIKYGTHYWGSSADIMPSFGTVYDDKQLRSVAHYISQTFNPHAKERVEKLYAQSDPIPKEKKAKMLKRGKKIYKRNCSWCHGVDAKGDGEATHNPEKSIYPYDLTKTLLDEKQMFLYAKYGGKFWGTDKDDMPSWKRKYKDFTLKSVIYYIEETYRKDQK